MNQTEFVDTMTQKLLRHMELKEYRRNYYREYNRQHYHSSVEWKTTRLKTSQKWKDKHRQLNRTYNLLNYHFNKSTLEVLKNNIEDL